MAARLPSRAENSQNRSIVPRHLARRESTRGRDPHALNDAVWKNRQWLARFRREKKNQANPLFPGRRGDFRLHDCSRTSFPMDDVRVETQRHDLPFRKSTFHRLENVEAVLFFAWKVNVRAGPIDRSAVGLLFVRFL